MPRWLGIDYGQRRLGLALSDALLMTAKGLPTFDRGKATQGKQQAQQAANSLKLAVQHVVGLVQTHAVEQLVVGYPLSLSGEPSAMAHEVEAFVDALEDALDAVGLHKVGVALFDERLTSKLAESNLQAKGQQGSRDKGAIDQEAARLVLLDYIAHQHPAPLSEG
jgi:putative Holliday junction resolvase